jgi:hypothetical protein
MREFGALTVDSYVAKADLVDGKLSRSLRKYMDTLVSDVRADGAYDSLSLFGLV